jgi:murein DD-endopeptidase MepM/ murein hydrolase activator NlpD
MYQFAKTVKDFTIIVLILAIAFSTASFAIAQSSGISDLEGAVEEKKSEIDVINQRIDSYQDEVEVLAGKTESLMNELGMISNHVIIAQLDIALAEIEIETNQLELDLIKEQQEQEQRTLDDQRELLSEMLFELNITEGIGMVEVLFGSSDFNQLFADIEQLENVNSNLTQALASTKETQAILAQSKEDQQEKLERLLALQEELQTYVAKLETQESAKNALVDATQGSEAEYRVLVSELRQERQYVNAEVARIQAELEDKIRNFDDIVGDPGTFTWPLQSGIITAAYHDPTYPWRYLFEHSGTDMAAPTGTAVMAASPGYVAQARTGKSFGNYIIVIHDGGFATLYAHLSRIDVMPDQFVARGQTIGLVGSTGFSSGPHLHFELRKDGFPVDAEPYLVGNLPRP